MIRNEKSWLFHQQLSSTGKTIASKNSCTTSLASENNNVRTKATTMAIHLFWASAHKRILGMPRDEKLCFQFPFRSQTSISCQSSKIAYKAFRLLELSRQSSKKISVFKSPATVTLTLIITAKNHRSEDQYLQLKAGYFATHFMASIVAADFLNGWIR